MDATAPDVRAIFRAVRVPGLKAPNDTAHAKIHYPAAPEGTPFERDTGLVPARRAGAPLPVVLLLGGINVGPEGFGWLARRLARAGMVTVTYALIAEELPGQIGASPGLDVGALAPGALGTRPSATVIGPILAALAVENGAGVLEGLLDLSRVALGGHSAGGTVALLNARPDWFAGVRAAFSHGAHTAAASMLGHAKGAMNPVPPDVPVLIMGGDSDGVIAGSAARYGDPDGDATGRVIATFEEAVTRTKGDCVLAILKGGNHFSPIDPPDPTVGRAFLDRPETLADSRGLLGALIESFLRRAFGMAPDAACEATLEARAADFAILRSR
jgi:dienelactone hydrolase